MKTLLFTPLVVVALTSCSVGVRPRAGPQSQVEKMAMLANAEIAFARSPTAENHIALGLALASFGRHEAAIERYEQAAAISQGGTAAYSHLCLENNILRRWDEAIRNCEKALSTQPNHAVARNGLRYAQKAKSAEATSSEDSSNQINLGMRHYSKGEWTTAIEVWSQISAGSPYFATAQSNIASAYILLKNFQNARIAIDQALQLEPNNELFRNNAKWLEQETAKAR